MQPPGCGATCPSQPGARCWWPPVPRVQAVPSGWPLAELLLLLWVAGRNLTAWHAAFGLKSIVGAGADGLARGGNQRIRVAAAVRCAPWLGSNGGASGISRLRCAISPAARHRCPDPTPAGMATPGARFGAAARTASAAGLGQPLACHAVPDWRHPACVRRCAWLGSGSDWPGAVRAGFVYVVLAGQGRGQRR